MKILKLLLLVQTKNSILVDNIFVDVILYLKIINCLSNIKIF